MSRSQIESNLSLEIIGFILLLFLSLLSALLLFQNHYGFDIQKIYILYAGDRMQPSKSFSGILKSFSPHILVMPLSFFILFHFVLILKIWTKAQIISIGILGFFSTFGDLLINFLIAFSPIIAAMKIVFFILFELVMSILLWTLFRQALRY